MTPPRFVHWAHMSNKFSNFCSRLSLVKKLEAQVFKIARARGRVRGLRAPKIKAATLRLRHFAYSVHFVYLAHLSASSAFGAQRACLCTHRPPADPSDRGAQPAASQPRRKSWCCSLGASRGNVGRSFQSALPQPAKCRRSTAASALVNSPVCCNPPPPP